MYSSTILPNAGRTKPFCSSVLISNLLFTNLPIRSSSNRGEVLLGMAKMPLRRVNAENVGVFLTLDFWKCSGSWCKRAITPIKLV